MDNNNKRKNGTEAEKIVLDYLLKHNLQLLEKNFSCVLGEIDLIMQDNENIIFIEVRSRQFKNHYATALESVDSYKQKKIVKTATYYLQKKNWLNKVYCRFDVVGIQNTEIEWIKDAFNSDYY